MIYDIYIYRYIILKWMNHDESHVMHVRLVEDLNVSSASNIPVTTCHEAQALFLINWSQFGETGWDFFRMFWCCQQRDMAFWHLFSKVWCFSTSFYLWGEYWVEHRARNLREGEAQCAQLSINSAIKQFFQCVFLLDVPGKGLGTASPEPDSKAQRQAREERLVRVGSTDANVPWQAQHMLKSKGVLQILTRRGWWG